MKPTMAYPASATRIIQPAGGIDRDRDDHRNGSAVQRVPSDPRSRTLPDVYITGIGTRLGSRVESLDEIGVRFGLSATQLRKLKRKCGPQRLYKFAPGETLEQVAGDAIREAMGNASLSAADITGLYASTGGPVSRYALPDFARVLADESGLRDIDTVNMSMGCVGGIDCILAAAHRLMIERWRGRRCNYLVVCGDQAGLTHVASERSTAFLFSEGVACFVLSNEPGPGFRIDKINAVSTHGDPFCMKLENAHAVPGAKFEMAGEAVYEFAVKTALPRLPQLLGIPAIPDDAYCIFHQASLSILRQIVAQGDIDPQRVYSDGIREIGNTSGASVMFGLQDAAKKGYLRGFSRVLLGAFGVGLKVGAVLLVPVIGPAGIESSSGNTGRESSSAMRTGLLPEEKH